MYQTFTGSSRRPRQVNLSGRKPNPFASSNSPSGPQQALQNAHQDRAQRQQQRAELTAAKTLQRVWRGHRSRRRSRDEWRAHWDTAQEAACKNESYKAEQESLESLRLLMLFFSPHKEADVERLLSYGRLQANTATTSTSSSGDTWPRAYVKLEKACITAMESMTSTGTGTSRADDVARLLVFLVAQIPHETAQISDDYFRTMTDVFRKLTASRPIFEAVKAPLQVPLLQIYTSFISEFLTRPQSSVHVQRICGGLDQDLFVQAAVGVTRGKSLKVQQSLWLLSQFIFVVSETSAQAKNSNLQSRSTSYISVVAKLLAVLADHIDAEAKIIDLENDEYDEQVLAHQTGTRLPLNAFLKRQFSNLVDQDAIRWLLVRSNMDSNDSAERSNELAGYALTLLRVFPRHADDIRMWLYLGPPQSQSALQSDSAVAYFWKESKNTHVFRAIYQEPKSAIELLTANNQKVSAWQPPSLTRPPQDYSSDWRLILIFFELYTFVLKLMDDEEFLGHVANTESRLRSNALPLTEVKDLTLFLKNLGFAMYYHAQQISEALDPGQETLSPPSLSRHFGSAAVETPKIQSTQPPASVGGITGMSVGYVKGLVTGLLRAIYERDSRRKFLPQGHWLMTSRFDMSNFIQAVVAEEENRHLIQEQEDEDGPMDLEEDLDQPHAMLSRDRRIHDVERRQRELRKASRRRYLESVAPRLEILQNMPFLIPFETRVQIFREFVNLDMEKRRNGFVDPDYWRQSVMFRASRNDPQQELLRHHAKIRRKHEFDDAFEQFYELGADLKEPIQITFVDEFDIVEAGIDGGGVTKEFLTSVTSEALNPDAGLFATNSQHLLYPNPTKLASHIEDLRALGISDPSPELRAETMNLLRRYEFLGRIVGKCLYEGILLDIGFAGFFLIKWALFGGYGSAPQESGYRANINDLRDLDEALYQGLLTLKNYPGNVEDLGLTFVVTDEIPLPNGRSKAVDTELDTDGANKAVTNENRLIYISRMARYRLQTQSQRQTTAFLRGLSSIVQPGWLSMFNQTELQTLIGGAAASIDVPDLRRNTQYGGVYVIGDDLQEHPSIQMFWNVMEKMSDEDRRKVLKFVTSTPRAPLLGFGSLNPRFSIRDSGEDEARFPTTSTCVNLLKLPRYRSEAVLRDKLLYAVNSGAGFDLS